jgi:cytochrome P450/ferredoxin-NADP reductase
MSDSDHGKCPMHTPKADWDPLDPAHAGDPTHIHATLRASCPVAWSDRFGGFYALTRYEDVTQALLDVQTFTSAQKTTIPDITGADRPPRAPVEMDPPVHEAYRDMLNRFFTPDRIRLLEPVIRRTARDLLGRCVADGDCDIVAAFTFFLPIQVQCIFLGLPLEDAEKIKNLANRITEAGAAGDTAAHKAGNDEMYAYIGGVLEARRKTPYDPNDLISALLNEEIGGRRQTLHDVAGTVRLFLQAGHGTTTNALGSIVRHLALTPSDQQRLRESPKTIPQAIEEMLRMWTPVRLVGRKTTCDVEVAGRLIPKGSKVAMMVAAANRDAAAFDDADTVDFDRRPNRHIAMGHGIHRCVGAALARAQLRIAVEELLALTDEVVMTGAPEFSTWSHMGPSRLPVRLVPRTAQAESTTIPSGHRELAMTVAAVRPMAERTVELELRMQADESLPEWTPGAHIDLILPGNLLRSYSLVGDPADRSTWRIAVLEEAHGRGGSKAIHRLKAGDAMRVRPPRNNFVLRPAPAYHFFASGIGITPLLPMIDAICAKNLPWRLDYVGRREDQLAYLDRLSHHAPVHVHLTATSGRPDLAGLLALSTSDTAVFACGSQAFLLGLESAAKTAGRDFHTEWFAPKPGARQGTEGSFEAFTVHMHRSKCEVNVLPGQTIIDACAEAGVEIAAACFEGTCGTCLTNVLEGTPDHRDSFLSPGERRSNRLIATCVSKSMTRRLVLDC